MQMTQIPPSMEFVVLLFVKSMTSGVALAEA
jgi:hypothetical protein